MDLLDTKTEQELLRSIIAETAKAKNEVACAKKDLEKATNRLNFVVVLANKLIDRGQINGTETTSNQAKTA